MIEYKSITEMADEEIEFVVRDLLSWDIEKITNIDRDYEENEIIVEFMAIWYSEGDDGKEIISLNEEEIVLSPTSARGAEPYDSVNYRKYMLAKGYHPLLKDNKWLE